jgi:hypothetical protein
MEAITVLIYKKGHKTDCNNCRGTSLLSTSYKILSNNLVWKLSPCVDKIIGDQQWGFQCKKWTADEIFGYVRHWKKKWDYNETVHQLFIDFKKGCALVRR